jgi:protocatechuate 3,4-dioxygenase, alpha subunit
MTLPETPSQTVGPFFSIGMTWESARFVVPEGAEGAVWLRGRVFDGEGAVVPDAVVETWQTDEDFRGFGRSPTDEHGRWAIHTRKTPHADVAVFARGLLRQVLTRCYFEDAADPVLDAVDSKARGTLIAQPAEDGYVFDIHLQGPNETVFFAF